MAKNKLDPPDTDPQNQQSDAPARPSKLAAPRFSIQLTEGDEDEQSIDLAKMQKGNREKLAALLKRGDTLKQLGVVTEPAPAALDPSAASALDAMLGAKAVELVGLLAVIGGQRALKLTPDAAALLAFSPAQREALAPLVVRILGKYNLLGGKYAEEMAAAALAVAMLADNYQKAKEFDGKQPSLPMTAA